MPSFTEKGQKSPNSCTEILWDVILKTTIPRLVESFEHIKCNRSNSQRHVKSFINPTRYNFQKICSWTRRNETIGKMKRITIFFDQQVFINYRKKTRQYFIVVASAILWISNFSMFGLKLWYNFFVIFALTLALNVPPVTIFISIKNQTLEICIL